MNKHMRLNIISFTIMVCVMATGIAVSSPAIISHALSVDEGVTADGDYTVTVIQKATEDTPGIRQYTNNKTGATYTEEIPATGHVWGPWITDVEPGPTTEGHRYRVCTRYPDQPHYEEDTIPPTGETTAPETTTAEETTAPESSAQNIETSAEPETSEAETEQESATAPPPDPAPPSTAAETEATSEDNGSSGWLLGGPLNAGDAVFTTATVGLAWWYLALLWPLILVLLWARKKRKEAEERRRREQIEKEDNLKRLHERERMAKNIK